MVTHLQDMSSGALAADRRARLAAALARTAIGARIARSAQRQAAGAVDVVVGRASRTAATVGRAAGDPGVVAADVAGADAYAGVGGAVGSVVALGAGGRHHALAAAADLVDSAEGGIVRAGGFAAAAVAEPLGNLVVVTG